MTTITRTPAPERSLEQRLSALDRANMIRTYRARFKRDLVAGERAWTEAFGDELMDSMKVVDLLVAIPKVGRVKANRAIRDAGVSPSKRVGGLTDRQRDRLIRALPTTTQEAHR